MTVTVPPKLPRDSELRVAPVVGIGTRIDGRYCVESIVGRGGMGLVVAARDESTGQRVAVKLLLPHMGDGPAFARRALREARAAAALTSEHATRVLDVGQLDSGLPYIVMELLAGLDFERLLAQRGALSVREVATYLVQACDAIAEAHGHGIVHRDLKPSNLFLTERDGAPPLVKLMDFGISKVLQTDAETPLTGTQDSPGTPRYMSPEQLMSSRNVDSRTDVWALGVIAFRMLTGEHPFDGETSAAVHIAIASKAAPNVGDVRPDVPAAIVKLIERSLAKSPSERLDAVSRFAAALLPFADAETQRRYSSPRGSGPLIAASLRILPRPLAEGHGRARAWSVRRRRVLAAVVVVAIALTGVAIGTVTRAARDGEIPAHALAQREAQPVVQPLRPASNLPSALGSEPVELEASGVDTAHAAHGLQAPPALRAPQALQAPQAPQVLPPAGPRSAPLGVLQSAAPSPSRRPAVVGAPAVAPTAASERGTNGALILE